MKHFKKPTVGDRLIGGDVGPTTARDQLMADLYAAKRMNRMGISRVFSPLTKKQVDLLESQKIEKHTLNTRLPSHE